MFLEHTDQRGQKKKKKQRRKEFLDRERWQIKKSIDMLRKKKFLLRNSLNK